MLDVKDNERYKTFTRRTAILSSGALGLFGVLLSRLYYIQVLESSEYTMLAEDNRVNVELIPPLRGRIYDRFGKEIASNRKNFRVILVPAQVTDINRALDRLSKIVPLTEAQRQKILRTAARQPKFSSLTVVQNLTWKQFAEINVNGPDLGGIQPDAGVTRFYPYGPELAHLVGYVAAVSEDEIHDDPVLVLPGFRIGKSGIEKTVEKELRGVSGTRQVEVDAFGRVIRELSRNEGSPGKDVVLTLDMALQSFALKRMAGESGAAVVLDVENGDILAMASVPGFDPNDFNLGLSQDTWDRLRNDELKPLLNKSIAGQYPPGSTFKMIVALAALEAGVMSPNETVYCAGKIRLGNHDFHCWRRGGHGWINMHNGIKHSCDVYFYEVAKRTGIDRIGEMAKRFGMGTPFDFGMLGEQPGLVPSRGWKLANFGESWQQGETLIAGIGQGFLLVTPIQLAIVCARLANGGKAVRPRIIRSIGEDSLAPSEAPSMGLSRRHLKIVQAGMNAVTNELRGTAYGSRITEKGWEMAGKTGTSQVRRITAAERAAGIIRNEDLPWKRRDHALFVAFAPVSAPRYAVSVFVEHGGSGSRVAAPIARDIMRQALALDPVTRTAIGPIATGRSIRPPISEEG